MSVPNTTPTPNELYNGEMNKMNDTELRVVLIVTRATLGWEINHKTGMRKQEDWISQKQLMEKSGKSNRAISSAVKSCVEKGWIEARDKLGNILLTPEERSGRKVFYRLGKIFLDKIGSETSSQGKPVNLTTKTSELNDIKPVKIVHSTKETLTKETIQKDINPLIELFKNVNPSYKQLFKRIPERKTLERLIQEHGIEKITKVLNILPKSNQIKYAPIITTPIQLENKLGSLLAFIKQESGKNRLIKL